MPCAFATSGIASKLASTLANMILDFMPQSFELLGMASDVRWERHLRGGTVALERNEDMLSTTSQRSPRNDRELKKMC